MGQRFDILFSDVPVVDEPEFIEKTFINREKELLAAKTLFQPSRLKNQIYAIHGSSRVGKSHLAIKLALDQTSQHNLLYFYVSANMKGTAEDVLTAIYEKIRDHVFSLKIDKNQDKDRYEHLAFLTGYLSQINSLFIMPTAKIKLRVLQKEATKIKADFQAKIPYLNLGASVSGEKMKGTDHEQTIELEEPNAKGIRTLIMFLAEVLVYISGQQFLILVDDLDLLEETSGGEAERDMLINQLKFVASLPPVAVWVTSRQQYFIERQKEMFNFIKVSFLREKELVEIYKARVRNYNNDLPIFTDEVLKELTEGFRGIAGSFLYECFLFWRYHLGEAYPLGVGHLSRYLMSEIEEFENNPETNAIFREITTAVMAKKGEVAIKDVKKGHGLIYRVLFPKGYEQDTYEILPLFAKIIINRAG